MAKSKIEIVLSAKDTGLNAALKRGQVELRAFGAQASRAVAPLRTMISTAMSLKTALAGAFAATAGGFAGGTLISSALSADNALFNLQMSIKAANKEFQNVGNSSRWGENVASLTKELKIYSEQAVQQAAAKTIDMTKRLGLNEQQMVKVVRAAANLGAGKFELADSVERVTAALRGEAEASEALGLTLSETYVTSWYEARGATQGAWKDLTDLQKAQVRYNVLLEQSAPLQGKAAASANTFGGALTQIRSGYEAISVGLGRVITDNQFFVNALKLGGQSLSALGNDVKANAGAWRLWAKESALSVLQFVADTSEGLDTVYRSLSGLGGTLKTAWAGTLLLGQGFQFLFEQANKVSGDTEKARYWAQAQVESARLIDQAMSGAAKSFEDAASGSSALQGVAEKITRLKEELAKVQPDEVSELAEAAKKADLEFVKVGNRWVAVEKKISQGNAKTAEQVGVDWGQVWEDFEKNGKSAAEAVDSALEQATRDREVTIKVKEVQQRATGGLIQRLAAGGKLPGFGGGDRIPALLEAGEFVIRKEAVSKFGSGLFHALNSLRLPEIPRFATGGAVGAGASGDSMTINFAFGGNAPVATMRGTREQAILLEREFARRAQRSSR